jgi:mannose-6-phosphate isomerase
MASSQKVYGLKGVVQHYSWGGYDFLPALLNLSADERKPWAEYWLGAHPNCPADAEGQKLDELLRKQSASLPFLLKVLDVRQMLSIQVHPDKASAKKGFDAENAAGVPLKAPHRNYKDDNHKPELMVALGEFHLLHGFKPEAELKKILSEVPELDYLLPLFEAGGYREVYGEVMCCGQEKVDSVLTPLMERIVPLYEKGELPKDSEHFWAARAAQLYCPDCIYDRGIFSVYLFNLLRLSAGEGVFQPAGMPHAYLEGQNIEIMANSDNVLRAGLTDKHIDIEELMKHIRFEPTIPQVLKGEAGKDHRRFAPPVEEFELVQYEWKEGAEAEISTRTKEIWLLVRGSIGFEAEGKRQELHKGGAVYVREEAELKIRAESPSVLFRALVPEGEKIR